MKDKQFVLHDLSDLASVRELLKKKQPLHVFFSSLYSQLPSPASPPGTRIPVGDGIVIKSDLPLLVRLGEQQEVRDVYDITVPANVQFCEIRAQLAATVYPDAQVCAYSLSPKKIINRWQRDVWDYPCSKDQQVINIVAATTSTNQTYTFPAYVQENAYLYSLQILDTGGTGTQVISALDITDQQGTPIVLWSRQGLAANTQMFTFVDFPRVKLPRRIAFLFTHSSDGVNTNQLTCYFNFAYR